ncbi:MAG TPA: hypothetical protein VGS07_00730 [Thermoanaerobaculia bacterium]|nr:hypothetical protein [Thermoanaerobaculia bacterium]
MLRVVVTPVVMMANPMMAPVVASVMNRGGGPDFGPRQRRRSRKRRRSGLRCCGPGELDTRDRGQAR